MDAIVTIGLLIASFVVFGLIAVGVGEDSRPWVNDEWRRLY